MFSAGSTAAKSVGGQFRSMGTTVSSAFGKAKSAIVAPFAGSTSSTPAPDKSDPTSLSNMPTKLSPELWVMQGQLAESQGQQAKALESYNKALNSEPNNLGALVSLARLYDRQGDSAKSVEYFQKAAAINASDASLLNDLGLAYSKAGNATAAKESMEKAAGLDPKNVRYRNNLATLLVEQGKADEAVTQLQNVLPPAMAHYNVAYLHFTKQNIPAAEQQLRLALQADPNLQPARDLMARLGGSQSIAQAGQTAGSIYQTVQGLMQPGATPATAVAAPSTGSLPAISPGAQPPAWLGAPATTPPPLAAPTK